MKTVRSISQMQKNIRKARLRSKTIGFVPTMGYLHQGHLSLVRKSKAENDLTVMSIFVNPTQFGPNEDYARYPRDKKRDESLAKKEKVDIIFYPSDKTMYPDSYLTYVNTEKLSEILCGRFRPGHFQGVTTIIAKLLNIVTPDLLYLGQKDIQQAVILRQMIRDLNFPVKVKICPIVREKDGLAMSSRNKHLDQRQRAKTPIIYQSLKYAKKLIQQGERNPKAIQSAVKSLIFSAYPCSIDYVECVNADTLKAEKQLRKKALIALAVWFGNTRLIDNLIVHVK